MSLTVLPFPEDRRLATGAATVLGARLGRLDWHRFPDGESLVTLGEDIEGNDVVVLASLKDPDQKALPLRFAAQTARDLGARSVGLVAPYLAYMRQDKRFHPGEAVSARLFAQFLDESVDWLVTVDPHLHRITSLDSVFRIPTTTLSAAPYLAEWIQREVTRPLLIGPDSESAQWVADVARAAHAPYEVLRKVRRGDRDVEVSLPNVDHLRGYTPVLVDDIVSSGRTLAATLEHLGKLGLPPAVCVVIHPIFAGDAWEAMGRAGAGRIVSTDSIVHPSNAISLVDAIARAIEQRIATRRQEAAS